MNYLSVIVLSYFIGSFPTAYLFRRIFYNKDITREGTGNVGTLNFFRLSRSVSLGILVLFIDLFKGFLALWLTAHFYHQNLLLISSVAVIIGHIYPLWLRGKGGRGLAPLAGIFIFVQPVIILIWWIIFGIFYLVIRKYIISGMIALFLVNIISFLTFQMDVFLILSVNSIIIMLKYMPRIKEELLSKSS